MEVRYLLSGDMAVSIQFGQEISLELNKKVRALQHILQTDPIAGVTEVVPTYASLMVHYRPETIRYASLREQLEKRIANLGDVEMPKAVVVEVPIIYGGKYGPDLEVCAKTENISVEEMIKIHSENEYYVYMLGFAPGHAYMARFNQPFSFQRRESPRLKINGGSVVAAQNLSNLIPFDQPCGWNILGATPVTICDYQKEKPFLVNAGQWVKFVPITEKEFINIQEQSKNGTYHCKTYEKNILENTGANKRTVGK